VTRAEMKLAAHLLRMAVEEFSNHGCNDFYLGRNDFTLEERKELSKLYDKAFMEPGDSPRGPDGGFMDWGFMKVVAEVLEKEAEKVVG